MSESPTKGQRKLEEFKTILSQNEGDWIILFTQVDPDAMGSAAATHMLAKELLSQLWPEDSVPNVSVMYCGSVANDQNRWIWTTYSLDSIMQPFDVEQIENKNIILVDSSTVQDARLPGEIPEPLIVLDHHKGCDIPSTDDNMIWLDIVGAASTLVYELIEAYDTSILTREIADLLSLGIFQDTRSLMMNATARDHSAFFHLGPFRGEIHRAMEFPLAPSHFDHKQEALKTRERQDHVIVASAGYIESAESGDDIAFISDELIRMEGVTLVVVWGIVSGKIRFAARNTNASTRLDQFLKSRFGARSGAKVAPSGKGEGGGLLELSFALEGLSDEDLATMIRGFSPHLLSCLMPDMGALGGVLDDEQVSCLVKSMRDEQLIEILRSATPERINNILGKMNRKQLLQLVRQRMNFVIFGPVQDDEDVDE